jgi:hypothetical protein
MLVGSSPQAAVYNTPDQARSQFSLWSVMAAPLLIGSNILNLSAWDFETYTNLEVQFENGIMLRGLMFSWLPIP